MVQQTRQVLIANATIATMDLSAPTADALLIADGRFVAVGTAEDVIPRAAEDALKIDARGRTIVPGLNDSHIHLIRGGLTFNTELRWDGILSLAEAMRLLREQVRRTPPPQWVRVVGGWSPFQFLERRLPTLDELNAIAPETPVVVTCMYSRALLNRAALEAAGIDRSTPEPPSGRIDRDERGNPTGLLLAQPNPRLLYEMLARAPRLAHDDQLNSTRQYLRELNRFGITSICDAAGGGQHFPQDYAVFEELHLNGQLTVRTAYSLFPQEPSQEIADIERWVQNVDLADGDEYLRVNGIGELLVSSAGDFEDFMDPRPELPEEMEPALERAVHAIVKHRWPFRIHATYGESIWRFLNVFERVDRDVPFAGLRWNLDHAETIREADIPRVAALGGGIAIQHRLAYQGEYFVERYGREAASNSPPVRRILTEGVPLGLGTDATRVSTYNPWVALHWYVTGRTVGGLQVYERRNLLERGEALRQYTHGNAAFSGEADVKGTIKPGMLGDLAVLSDDYFGVEADAIVGIESVLTIIGGRIVHAAAEFSPLAPPPLPASPSWSPRNFQNVSFQTHV
ncbi:MAG: amidohydrolase [Chloroflexi bacterium]|nr:amidohydrolase [Chloroflexota bacterium]